MRKHIRCWAILVAMTAPLPVRAADYADPACIKPEAKLVAPSATDQDAVLGYNARVRRYNKQVTEYSTCMRAYIDKANADIKIIQDNANVEMARIRDTANSDMRQIEGKIRDAAAAVNTPLSEPPADRSTRLHGR
jgi:hypothetical protein